MLGLITDHWSATSPNRIRDYHVEFALRAPLPESLHLHLLQARTAADVNFGELKTYFDVFKNFDLGTPTSYGTYHLNHDPRGDGSSADVEIGALCMGGEGVSTSGSWGRWPYTIAHAWMHAALNARVAALKGIDTGAAFDVSVEPSVLQSGPIHTVSTHAERALQTVDADADGKPFKRPDLGYFIGSGDPDSRWDLAVLDPTLAGQLADAAGACTRARAAAIASASWIRARTHEIKLVPILDYWGLDKPAT